MSQDRRKRGRPRPPSSGGRPPSQRPERPRRQPRGRPKGAGGGAYWLYGRHPGLAALANSRRHIERALATASFQEANGQALAKAGAGEAWPLEIVEPGRLDRIAGDGAVHQGIALAVRPLEQPDVAELRGDDAEAVVLVLDQANDPRNVGAAIRAAAAFAAKAVVTTARGAPPESGALAKAAAGALEITPYVQATNLARGLATLKENGFWTVGLDGAAETDLAAAPFDRPTAIVMGAEGRGLRRLTAEACDALVRIPIAADVESLNVATAAAIALYERRRS